jgi:hypothetical protein
MHRCVAYLALACACLFASVLPRVRAAEAPTPDSAQRAAALRSLATEVSQRIKAETQKPPGAGTGGDPKSKKRAVAADSAQFEFDRFAKAAEPSKNQLTSIGNTLYMLAAHAPDIYRSLLADATIRSGLFEAERSFATPFFADGQSIVRATALWEHLGHMAQDMAAEEPDKKAELDEADDRPSSSKIVSRLELDASLKGLGEALGSANLLPIPRSLAPVVLVEATKFLHGRLIFEAKTKEFEFAKELMLYLGESNKWQARNLFLHFATLEPDDAALAAELGEIYLRTHCTSAASADYACLSTLSLLQFHYQTLQDRSRVVKTRIRLDDALKQNLKLKLALSKPGHQGNEGDREREGAVGQLLSLIPRLDDFGRDGAEGMLRKWNELQADSYWLVKAAGKYPKDFARVLASQRRSYFSGGTEPVMITAAAFSRALALADGKTALVAIAMLRSQATEMTEGAASDNPEWLQMIIQLDIMELLAWQAENNMPRSRQIGQRIQSRIAPILTRKLTAEDSFMPTCPPPARTDPFVMDSAQTDFFESVHTAITQLQIQWDLKEGKRVALPLVYTILAQDVRDLFKPRSVRTLRRSNGDEDKQPEPLSPAQFVVKWVELYRPALGGHPGQLRQAATTVKCLLGLPGLEPQLAADFVNKDSAGRAELAKALYTLLEDSGTLAQTKVADGDFRLLQLVSVLQAHLGISAAAARSAFPGEIREKVRQAEVGIAKLKRNMDSFRNMVNLAKLGDQGNDMFSLLEIAGAYPEAYAKYAELKQQSIATLGGVTAMPLS